MDIKRRGCKFRVTINGTFKDFKSLNVACEFILKNWKEKTTSSDIKLFCTRSIAKKGMIGYSCKK